MNYRINSEFPAPFRIFPYIDEVSNYKLELELRIRACYPKQINASYVIAKIPVPKTNSNIKPELSKVKRKPNLLKLLGSCKPSCRL